MAIGGWLSLATIIAQVALKLLEFFSNKYRGAVKKLTKEQDTKRDIKEIAHGDDAKDLDDYIDNLPR